MKDITLNSLDYVNVEYLDQSISLNFSEYATSTSSFDIDKLIEFLNSAKSNGATSVSVRGSGGISRDCFYMDEIEITPEKPRE